MPLDASCRNSPSPPEVAPGRSGGRAGGVPNTVRHDRRYSAPRYPCQEALEMSITAELFERWKKARGYTSDRAALLALDVSHGAAVHWRAGRNAEVHIIERMARDLGDDPLQAVARAME